MPLWVAALLGGLIQVAGTLVGKVLLSLGFGYVSYTGLDASLGWIKAQIAASMGGLPSQAVSVLGAAGVGSAVAIVMSAIAARMLLDGLTGGAFKRLVMK